MKDTPLQSISALLDVHFLVEDYQRGYKWTSHEVKQLLQDIESFDNKGFYCLQPLVVKEIRENSIDKIELIDGQQRITTIFLILSYLQADKYTLEYRTRTTSQEFLKNIFELTLVETWNDYVGYPNSLDNIDNYHFFNAFKTIQNWFKDKNELQIESFKNKLYATVKVIWYKVQASNLANSKKESIEIFTRINSGKINLTNAELIKALLLINIGDSNDNEKLILKQNEIAQQWDNIEYTLQNDDFWYFLTNQEPTATRIELIFDLIQNKEVNCEDKLFTFLAYNQSYADASDKLKWSETQWDLVIQNFQTLQEWYKNRELFHLIGFLIWRGTTIREILDWQNNLSKSEFKKLIKQQITIKTNLAELSYGNPNIKQVLLLFNIVTLLQNETSSNFSFEKFKNEKWDIEHIHAKQSQGLNSKELWDQWLNETKAELDRISPKTEELNLLIQKIHNVNTHNISQEIFDKLFAEVIEFFNSLEDDPSDINEISNLALLDAGTNRSYKNAIFSTKRSKIKDQDQKGVFIPICTKNVFLKYYSDDISKMYLWTAKDQKAYFKAINDTLKDYITPA